MLDKRLKKINIKHQSSIKDVSVKIMQPPLQQSTYLSVDKGNTDHVIMKQHAALPSEPIQLLFTHK